MLSRHAGHGTEAGPPSPPEPSYAERARTLVHLARHMCRGALLGRLSELCRRLLGRPASESGTLCHGDGAQGKGDRLRRSFMLPVLMLPMTSSDARPRTFYL